MNRVRCCLWIVASCLVACGDAEPDAGSALATWSADSTPILDIPASTAAGEVAFGAVAAATRLSSGHVVMADAYDAVVRFFAPSGALVRTAGRRGAGPNEFRSTSWLGQCGQDSIYVWDRVLARMSVLDREGAIVRQFRLEPTASTIACSRAGAVAYFGPPEAPASSVGEMASARYRAPLMVRSSDSSTAQTLAILPLGEPRPLGRVTSLAVAGNRILVGTADSGIVDIYTISGETAPPIRFAAAPRQPTQRQYEAAIEKQLTMLPRAADREPVRTLMRSMPMPDAVPAYSAILADPLGVVWVQETVSGDGETRFRLLRNGAEVGALRLPREITAFEVGFDYLLAGYRDADAEEHLALFRVHRGI